MNGAESLIHTLLASGIDVCFANPGTSEMHLVAALDRITGMRPVLCLFEGVVTGAADGYARMAGKPACTLLHLGPGLGYGIGNLHNARRANSPIVNIVGDHARGHHALDAPLTSDIELLARNVSAFVRKTMNSDELSADATAAIRAALTPPGQVATLIMPADIAWSEGPPPGSRVSAPPRPKVEAATIKACAALLRSGKPAALLLNGEALSQRGLDIAGRIAAKTGCRLVIDTLNARVTRDGSVKFEKLPYFAEMAVESLSGVAHLITVGTRAPVAFFAYPNKPGSLVPEGTAHFHLASRNEDIIGALGALADELGAKTPQIREPQVKHELPTGPLNGAAIAQALAALMPEGAIISDEGATVGAPSWALTQSSPPHDWLSVTGGSIGQGMAVATGAAVACPDRKVICIHGDGGAMYTLQALWTQARERLDVVTIILANRKYAILQIEFGRVGAGTPGRRALDMLDLTNPELNWVDIAHGLGVEGSRAESAEEFVSQLRSAIAAKGPRLIEAVIA